MEPELKLYVVGESSGNPEDWPDNRNRYIVLARSIDEAKLFCDSLCCGPVTLIKACGPCVLSREHFEES